MEKINIENYLPIINFKKSASFKIQASSNFALFFLYVMEKGQQGKEITTKEISKKLQFCQSTVNRYILDLLNWNLIYKIGTKKKENTYRIEPPNKDIDELIKTAKEMMKNV